MNCLSFKLTATGDQPWHLVMEQLLEHDNSTQKNFGERVVNVHREKSHKCNQCDYASIQAGNLKRHLKMHSGEKSNKCNQCDFASSQAGHLRAHLKTHSLLKCNSLIVHGNFLIHPFLVKSYHLLPKVVKN